MAFRLKIWTTKEIDVNDGSVHDAVNASITAFFDAEDDLIVTPWQVNTSLYVDAGSGNDTIIGSSSARKQDIFGAAGDDVIRPLHFSFWTGGTNFDGGSGNDTLDLSLNPDHSGAHYGILANLASGTVVMGDDYASRNGSRIANFENLIGSDASDILTGNSSGNRLAGGPGHDTMDGRGGNDVLYGDGGDDQIDGGVGNDVLYGDSGDDQIYGGAGKDFLDGGIGNDVLDGGSGNDTLFGQDGNDRFVQSTMDGSDTIDGGAGRDTADFSANYGAGEHIVADLTAGTVMKYRDSVLLGTDKLSAIEGVTGTGGNDYLSSGNFALSASLALNGGAGGDSLYGAAGDDTLIGGAGNDFMYGAQGYNHFMQDHWDDSDFLFGGSSSNVADYSGLVLEANMTASADPHIVANLGINRIEKFVNGAALGRDAVVSVNDVTGSSFNDVLNGNAQANALFGGAGNDVLVGAAGDDSLAGGSGNDTLDAGTGNDGMRLDGGGDDVFIFKAGFGTDVISVSNTADIVGHATVQFEHIAADNVLFQRLGDDLQITIAGTTDNVSISNWYGLMSATGPSSDFAIDAFQAGDAVLDAATVAHLVTVVGAAPVAMSSLSGEIVFPMPFETASPVLF